MVALARYESNIDKLQAYRILASLKLNNKIAVTSNPKMSAISGTQELVARPEMSHFLATV